MIASALSPASDGRLHDRLALLAQFHANETLRIAFFAPRPIQHEKADLEIDVVLQALNQLAVRAPRTRRARPSSRNRQGPGFVLGCEDEEDDDEAEHEGHHGVPPDFFSSKARPTREGVALRKHLMATSSMAAMPGPSCSRELSCRSPLQREPIEVGQQSGPVTQRSLPGRRGNHVALARSCVQPRQSPGSWRCLGSD